MADTIDILAFNKEGGVGIYVPPVGDSLTLGSYSCSLPVYDRNGNTTAITSLELEDTNTDMSDLDDGYKYVYDSLFENPIPDTLTGYNIINVPSRKMLYTFNITTLEDVYIDVPAEDIEKFERSKYTQVSSYYTVVIDNTEGSNIKIYYKNCEYAEVEI